MSTSMLASKRVVPVAIKAEPPQYDRRNTPPIIPTVLSIRNVSSPNLKVLVLILRIHRSRHLPLNLQEY